MLDWNSVLSENSNLSPWQLELRPARWVNKQWKNISGKPLQFLLHLGKKTVQNVVGIFKQPNTEHCQFLTWIQLKERRNVQEFEDQVCSLELPGTKKLNIIVILWSKFPERSLKIPSLMSNTSDEYRYWVTSVRALQKHWNFLVVKHKLFQLSKTRWKLWVSTL